MLSDRFEEIRRGDLTLAVRREERDWLLPLLSAAPIGFPDYRRQPLAGGRGATLRIDVDSRSVAVRAGRRGGLLSHLVSQTYLGFSPRVLDEIEITEYLRDLDVPVPHCLGAAVQWRMPGCYRSWLASELIMDACSLWQWLREAGGATPYDQVALGVGAAVRRMHLAGVIHPDLNLHNILIVGSDPPKIFLIDFDRARRLRKPIAAGAALIRRLEGSAQRLDPERRHVPPRFVAMVREGYEQASRMA